MTISSVNYPQPVQVNGFTCRNCTDVDNAKKHVDPAHPKSGPYDVDAATDPSRSPDDKTKIAAETASAPPVTFANSAGALLNIRV